MYQNYTDEEYEDDSDVSEIDDVFFNTITKTKIIETPKQIIQQSSPVKECNHTSAAPWLNVKFDNTPVLLCNDIASSGKCKSSNVKFKKFEKNKTSRVSINSLPVLNSSSTQLKREDITKNTVTLELPEEEREIIKSKIQENGGDEEEPCKIEGNEGNLENGENTEELDYEPKIVESYSKKPLKSLEQLREEQQHQLELDKLKREKRIKKNTQRAITKEKENVEMMEKINKKMRGDYFTPKKPEIKDRIITRESFRGDFRQTPQYQCDNHSQQKTQKSQPLLQYIPTPIQTNQPLKKRTKFCDFWLNTGNCTREQTCNFAHSVEQYQPDICKFDLNCRYNNTCKFRHSSETIQQMLKRLKIKVAKTEEHAPAPPPVIEKAVQQTPINPTRGIRNLQPLGVKKIVCPEGERGAKGTRGGSGSDMIEDFIEYTTTRRESYVYFELAVKRGYKSITINFTD